MNHKVQHHPAARVRWLDGPDEYWTGPVRDPKALDCLVQLQRARGKTVWAYFDYGSITAADEVLKRVQPMWFTFGPGDRYGVWVSRLRPVNESMAAAAGMDPPEGSKVRGADESMRGCTGTPLIAGTTAEPMDRGYRRPETRKPAKSGPLPPLHTGAGASVGTESPAAEPAPGLLSWFLWMIGVV